MIISNRDKGSNQVKQEQIVRRHSRRFPATMTIVMTGLILGILAVLLLPVENWAAAAPLIDEPCAVCDRPADAVRYGILNSFNEAKAEARLTASTPRYTGRAALYTASRATSDVRLGGLAEFHTEEFHAEKVEACLAACSSAYPGAAALHTVDGLTHVCPGSLARFDTE